MTGMDNRGAADGSASLEIEFGLLGPLTVGHRGQPIAIAGHRQRVILAMFLLEPRRVITVDRITRAIWEDRAPTTASTQIQICVSQLRKAFAGFAKADLIRTHPYGYRIDVPEETIDIGRFRRLVRSGRALASKDQIAASAETLRTALGLWRGDVASDVPSRIVQAAAFRLDEERLAVLQQWLTLELELGRDSEHIAELTELVTEYPLREKLHVLLALALYRVGRQAEALAACRAARQLLRTEHGIDPGLELRQLERAILTSSPDLRTRIRPGAMTPRQLPAVPTDFVGRNDEVAQVCRTVAPGEPDSAQGRGRIMVISGAAGVGKTALAVQSAHQVLEHFSDGQLFARLRGSDGTPTPTEQVLKRFLCALGVPPATMADDIEDLIGHYRSQLADRRVLIVLDDLTSESQLRPLLPGGRHCALIITSRHALAGTYGGHRLTLGVLDPCASLALVTRVIGQARTQQEPEATVALTEVCGHLPLALQVAAAKVALKEHWRVAHLVSRMRDERRRLDELTLNDVGVRPSILISYRALDPLAGRLFRLLGVLGTTDFSGWVVAPLLDEDFDTAADALDRLVDARLVEVQSGSGHQTRYRLHDLTLIFARERLAQETLPPERAAAEHRLLRCWLFLVTEARRREVGGDYATIRSDALPWPLPPQVVNELQADPPEWLQSESTGLLWAVSLAAQLHHDDLCWDLSVTSVTLFELRAHYKAWQDTHQVALKAARAAGNRRGEAVLRYSLGGLALAEKRMADARREATAAFEWFAQAGDAHGRGLALQVIGDVDLIQGRHDEARSRYEAAVADLRAVGDRVAEATTLRSLGQLHLECGRAQAGQARLRQALAACEGTGARRVEAQIRYRLGEALVEEGRFVEAQEMFTAMLIITERSTDAVGRGHALLGLGSVHLRRGAFRTAERYLGGALAAATTGGSRLLEGLALVRLAELLFKTGDRRSAVAKLDAAAAIFGQLAATRWLAHTAQVRREQVLAAGFRAPGPPDAAR